MDIVLLRLNVIWNPVVSHEILLSVVQGKTGSRITIARLANRSRVNQVYAVRFEPQLDLLRQLGIAECRPDGMDLFLFEKSALEVRVPEERASGYRLQQRLYSIVDIDQILIFVQRRTVYASDVGATFRLERTLRKHLQPFQIVGREILLRPNGRQGRNRIEACNIGHA